VIATCGELPKRLCQSRSVSSRVDLHAAVASDDTATIFERKTGRKRSIVLKKEDSNDNNM